MPQYSGILNFIPLNHTMRKETSTCGTPSGLGLNEFHKIGAWNASRIKL